jgi:hypothetical protein
MTDVLVDAGTIRVIDALILTKDADGAIDATPTATPGGDGPARTARRAHGEGHPDRRGVHNPEDQHPWS